MGEMVFPVTAGAFKDGNDRGAPSHPTSEAQGRVREPLAAARATLDPRHEIIEMNRPDNRVGGFCPRRCAFVRSSASSPDYIGINAGPTFWYGSRRRSPRRVARWALSPRRTFHGLVGFEAGLGGHQGRLRGVPRWLVDAMAIGARSRFRWLVADDEGLFACS
jgi:hypothetical protein